MPRFGLRFSIITTAMCIAALLSLSIGPRQDLNLSNLFAVVTAANDPILLSIFFDIRLPRTLAAALIGMNLALAGAALQAITRNALASPSVLGVNQGAALGIALSLLFPSTFFFNLNVMAVIGAFAAGALTFAFAGGFSSSFDNVRLILAGIAVGAFSYALMRFVFVLDDDLSRQVLQWTSGDISSVVWRDMAPVWIWTPVCAVVLILSSHYLNLLALGEAASKGLGIDPRFIQLIGAITAAILTGVSVSVAGPVLFVGLVVPHICRKFFGHSYRLLMPASLIVGATLVLSADALSKLINFPYETPLGVVCALIGAPYFLYQTLTSRGTKL